ncbi:MAG TPA: oxalate/formate MFS antiporter [Gemmatimonadaceae bacterium]|jgi:OFA family oxalate/formate antiporter-like MFS transporter
MTEAASVSAEKAVSIRLGRWWQLSLGVICMSMIANLQYGWTLFVNPIHDTRGWSLSAIQVAFTVFVLVETWLVPIEGYLVDKVGPRFVGVAAGILVALSWVINSVAGSLAMLYLGAIVGGIGAGAVYGACVGNALKWFPDRRGLAAGITAMGFGAGSAFTVFPIANMIKSQGYEATFFKFGIAQGAVVFLVSWLLRAPDASFAATRATPLRGSTAVRTHEYTPIEMLRTAPFWVMFVMFVLTAAGGLIATAQLTPIAKDFGVADSPVSLVGITLLALPFALSMNRVLNGVSRPFFGWVSDQLGREHTMLVAFTLEGAAILLLSKFGGNPMWFVLLTALVFFAYGEIYSLFPAICGDAYGRKFASANAGLLYVAKGVASLVVPVSSVIGASAAGWHGVFLVAAFMNFAAALLAIFVLQPLRRRETKA